jgi:hypothetical protein
MIFLSGLNVTAMGFLCSPKRTECDCLEPYSFIKSAPSYSAIVSEPGLRIDEFREALRSSAGSIQFANMIAPLFG